MVPVFPLEVASLKEMPLAEHEEWNVLALRERTCKNLRFGDQPHHGLLGNNRLY